MIAKKGRFSARLLGSLRAAVVAIDDGGCIANVNPRVLHADARIISATSADFHERVRQCIQERTPRCPRNGPHSIASPAQPLGRCKGTVSRISRFFIESSRSVGSRLYSYGVKAPRECTPAG